MTDEEKTLAYWRDTAAGGMGAKIEDLTKRVDDMARKVDSIHTQLSTYNGAQKALLWLAGVALAVGGWFANHIFTAGK